MTECTITINSMLAWLGWLLAVVCAVSDVILGEPMIARIGMLFAVAGATLHIRGFICGLAHRERAAFDLGRESVRSIR